MDLATAGLIKREGDLMAQTLQNPNGGHPGSREECVIETRKEEGDAHVSILIPRRGHGNFLWHSLGLFWVLEGMAIDLRSEDGPRLNAPVGLVGLRGPSPTGV